MNNTTEFKLPTMFQSRDTELIIRVSTITFPIILQFVKSFKRDNIIKLEKGFQKKNNSCVYK